MVLQMNWSYSLEEDLILFITVHVLLPVGAVLFLMPAVPLESTGALKGGLG